jgi:hypothetical protein
MPELPFGLQWEHNGQLDPEDDRVQRLVDGTPTADYVRLHGLRIEELAERSENPEELRARLEAAYRVYDPTTPSEVALVEQVVVAQLEVERLHRLRTALRAEASRLAEIRLRHAREDEVHHHVRLLDSDPATAVMNLKRSAPGLRYLVARWERLEKLLSEEGTWYGMDRCEAIQLQGFSAAIENIFLAEPAWETWRDCLAAQPNPKPRDIELISAPDVVPKAIQDRDLPLWRPDADACRTRLRALVEGTLPELRVLEARLRVLEEEPERAAVRETAVAHVERKHPKLTEALRSHEQSLHRAHRALGQRGQEPATPPGA